MTSAAKYRRAVLGIAVAGAIALGGAGHLDARAGGKGKKAAYCQLHGKVKFVSAFPDYKIQIVDAFPDAKVKMVDAFPDQPGKWKAVDAFPDFTVQVVSAFPDFKVKFVEAFPGCP